MYVVAVRRSQSHYSGAAQVNAGTSNYGVALSTSRV